MGGNRAIKNLATDLKPDIDPNPTHNKNKKLKTSMSVPEHTQAF